MTRKPLRAGRVSLRDRLLTNSAALDTLAALSGKPAPTWQTRIPPPPKPRAAAGSDGRVLERDVLAAGMEALRNDPRVALVERRQSGVFKDGDRYIRVGTPGTLDVSGMLVGGRYFELECKRPGEKPKPHQAERIAALKANGGISGYFTSAAEAVALLDAPPSEPKVVGCSCGRIRPGEDCVSSSCPLLK